MILAVLLISACSPGDQASQPRPRNVLLFVIDTLRADRMSAYGNPLSTTPNLDAFAREGWLFRNAHAPSPQTVPSHASLFTSTYPETHQAWSNIYALPGMTVYPRLAESHETLAEVLEKRGFQTAAVADGGWVIKTRGLSQGFESFSSVTLGVENRVESAIDWLKRRDPDRPFFLFLHTYQVHTPLLPPKGYEDRFSDPDYQGPFRAALDDARAWVRTAVIEDPLIDVQKKFFDPITERNAEDRAFLLALYDAELSLVDEAFGELRDFLSREGLLEDTLVVITSDHGEEFGEHGQYFHQQVYQELTHIPLIIRAPEGGRGLREEFVDLVDLMPTVLGWLGIAAPEAAVGLRIDLDGPSSELSDRTLVSQINQTWTEKQLAIRRRDYTAVLRGRRLKRVDVFAGSDTSQESNIASTPSGKAFMADAHARARAHLKEAREHRRRYDLGINIRATSMELSDEQRKQLEQLGYIQE